MGLWEKQTSDGSTLEKRLDQLLIELESIHAGAPDLFVHLRDLHDGAEALQEVIADLAALTPTDVGAINKRLWKIRGELYDHLLPNHILPMKSEIEALCESISEWEEINSQKDS